MSDNPSPADVETDPRFPSGPWVGYFLQRQIPGKHLMELRLSFRQGAMTGEGRDWVGEFVVRGRYSLGDGQCYWTKRYVGKHDVFYKGYNEGKGIWGQWDIPPEQNLGLRYHGGFHIWPEGMGNANDEHLKAEADVPAPVEEAITAGAK
jgi:hypothetical protein